ncbi:hypothetical protein JCM19233_1545 [Vibrio astriarenae]|nr:hypothetical protein JCM19233_1545 [Vibrio sp. C7]
MIEYYVGIDGGGPHVAPAFVTIKAAYLEKQKPVVPIFY